MREILTNEPKDLDLKSEEFRNLFKITKIKTTKTNHNSNKDNNGRGGFVFSNVDSNKDSNEDNEDTKQDLQLGGDAFNILRQHLTDKEFREPQE